MIQPLIAKTRCSLRVVAAFCQRRQVPVHLSQPGLGLDQQIKDWFGLLKASSLEQGRDMVLIQVLLLSQHPSAVALPGGSCGRG